MPRYLPHILYGGSSHRSLPTPATRSIEAMDTGTRASGAAIVRTQRTTAVVIPRSGTSPARLPDDKIWNFEIFSSALQLQHSHAYAMRLHVPASSLEAQLHDLVSASLTPLTRQYTPNQLTQISSQAEVFISAFHENAQWSVDVENLPPSIRNVLFGLTERSRQGEVGWRFLRFRFPYITFEWFLQTPYFEVAACTTQKSVEIEILWKAWSTAGAASGLVAYGRITDLLIQKRCYTQGGQNNSSTWSTLLVIIDRRFKVTRVFQPELMTPVPYLQHIPLNTRPDDKVVFSMSSNAIQFLRSSQVRMGFLVAISALFASIQPIVNNFSVIGGWIFSGIGILSGFLTVFALLLSKVLAWSELKAAKARQT